MTSANTSFSRRLTDLRGQIYPDHDQAELANEITEAFWRAGTRRRKPGNKIWSAKDSDLIDTVRRIGGLVSMRALPDGREEPYERNCRYFEAMSQTFQGPDQYHLARFICSQTIVMSLEGIPSFYIHSLLATPNDHEAVERRGMNRAINRHHWHYPDLLARLADPGSNQAMVLSELSRRLRPRARQSAFHPNATQFTLRLDDRVFGIWRQSLNRIQSIFAPHNVSAEPVHVSPAEINMIAEEVWTDALTGEILATNGPDIVLAPFQCRWITNAA